MVRPRFALHAGPRARAHSHPPHSPPCTHAHWGTPLPLFVPVGSRRPPHAPTARGLTVRGCARWGRGGLAPPPPPPSAPPLPRRSEARAALPNEERRCWQVGSVFVLG